MIDSHLAERLVDRAGYCLQAADHVGRGGPRRSAVAATLMAEALHCALVGMCAFRATIAGELEELPSSLVSLARTLENADGRDFQPYEIDKVALLDMIHERRFETTLLPDEFTSDIYHSAYDFVYRFIAEARAALQPAG